VRVDVRDGHAAMGVSRLRVRDFFNLPNALFGGTEPVRASVSFDVRWFGKRGRDRVRNDDQDVSGLFVGTDAAARFRARSRGVTYGSTDDRATTLYAAVGHERNGRFVD
jgi:hypothetical protein